MNVVVQAVVMVCAIFSTIWLFFIGINTGEIASELRKLNKQKGTPR